MAQMAARTVETQHEQNKMMHESNQKLIETTREVTQQGRELAEAAERLVAEDAQARKELVVAHREMRGELHAERVSVDQQRGRLEDERRDIAAQRVRDPIVAEAIQSVGLCLVALLPVCLAGYVLYSVNRSTDDQAAVSELLVLDLSSEHPRLLPGAPRPGIEGPRSRALPAPAPGDVLPPPF